MEFNRLFIELILKMDGFFEKISFFERERDEFFSMWEAQVNYSLAQACAQRGDAKNMVEHLAYMAERIIQGSWDKQTKQALSIMAGNAFLNLAKKIVENPDLEKEAKRAFYYAREFYILSGKDPRYVVSVEAGINIGLTRKQIERYFSDLNPQIKDLDTLANQEAQKSAYY